MLKLRQEMGKPQAPVLWMAQREAMSQAEVY